MLLKKSRHILPRTVAAVLLSICGSLLPVQAEDIINFNFVSSNGDKYNSLTLQANLKEHYGQEFPNSKVLLIETSDLVNPLYIAQQQVLEQLEHNDGGALYVIASRAGMAKDGYYTTEADATQLAPLNFPFRISLLSDKGLVLDQSLIVLTKLELSNWLGILP